MDTREGRGGGEKRSVRLFGVSFVRAVSEDEEDEEEDEVESGDGVGVGAEVLRKSKSMGNLASAEYGAGEHGYLSDGGLAKLGKRWRGTGARGRERKKGVPWTEEEHRTFLTGLEKLGKGEWRGISRRFVITRTPTQVASHAQKYFIRRSMSNDKKRRSSLFDVAQASISETTSTLHLGKTHEMPNDIKHMCQENVKGGTSELGSTHTVSKGPEIPPCLQLVANPIGVSEPCLLNNMVGVLSSMEEEKLMSVGRNVSSTLLQSFYLPHPPDIASPQGTHHPKAFSPPQANASYPVVETSDLELSIAPPKAL